MPIVIHRDIPAYDILKQENIFVMGKDRALSQDIRPIEIAILNLMPTKKVTETQLMRLLSNSPLQINITLLATESYTSKNTPLEHLHKFYKPFSKIKNKKLDGLIITGAPVETMEYNDVKYWNELEEIFDYAKTNVTSTIFICWGAQAALYHYYGIGKKPLDKKLFGVYPHIKEAKFEPLLKGMDDIFYLPHSRYTTIDAESIKACAELELLAYSKDAGAGIVKSKDNKFVFIFGHAEYDRETLDIEYKRDVEKGLDTAKPEKYYNEDGSINMSWASTANLLYVNWLNYFVYQVTPYKL